MLLFSSMTQRPAMCAASQFPPMSTVSSLFRRKISRDYTKLLQPTLPSMVLSKVRSSSIGLSTNSFKVQRKGGLSRICSESGGLTLPRLAENKTELHKMRLKLTSGPFSLKSDLLSLLIYEIKSPINSLSLILLCRSTVLCNRSKIRWEWLPPRHHTSQRVPC